MTDTSSSLHQPASLGLKFERGLVCAHRWHQQQRRKGDPPTPYIAHLLGVASNVIEAGGTEEEAVAALLHDAVEDQGGQQRLQQIQELFGDEVARLVAACSDRIEAPAPPWRERKETYIQKLSKAGLSVRRIAVADKLYNARSIIRDYRRVGPEVWERFRAGSGEVRWYYRALGEALEVAPPDPLESWVQEFRQVIEQMQKLQP